MAEHLRIMTLNLHTYQEIEKSKFVNLEDFFNVYKKINEIVADAIKEKNLDIICFQEAAQHKDMPVVMKIGDIDIKKHNAVLDIQNILKEKHKMDYNFIWDWSHYGWNEWEEGVGILTRFEIEEGYSQYVSAADSVSDIHSRKAVKGVLLLPDTALDVYSVHLNWWEKGFKEDIDNLFKWISESGEGKSFILAGDFNNAAGKIGYNYFMNKTINGEKIIDVDYKASKDNFYRQTIRGDAFNSTERIDYIITNDRPNIVVQKCQCIFTDEDGEKRVSDHMGVLAELQI